MTPEQMTEVPRVVVIPDEKLTPDQIEVKNKLNEERAALHAMLLEFDENLNSLEEADLVAVRTLIEEIQNKATEAGLTAKLSDNDTVVDSTTWVSKEQQQ